MFTDKVDLKDFPKMEPEYQELLKRVLAIQADCEIGGPHMYVNDIMSGAPTKADQLMVAKTAAEELDHYRKISRLAGHIGEDVSYVLSWPNQKRYVEAFRGRITSWEDFAIFGFLIDRVGRYQLEAFINCSYRPLAEILPVILKEEIGHVGYGGSKAADLMAKGDESRERLQNALNYWYVKALDMFGRAESKRSERYRYWGLKRRSNEQARNEYIKEVNPLIIKLGLQVPSVEKNRLHQ